MIRPMCKHLLLTFILALVWASPLRGGESAAIDRIKANYRAILTPAATDTDSLTAGLVRIEKETEMSDQVVIELHERYPYDMAKINDYLSRLRPDGSWEDINYADTKRSGWEPKQHADRLLQMVKLYRTPGSPRYGSDTLDRQIHLALGFWLRERPKCLNWWQNEIGIPKTLGPACLLIEDELSADERSGIIDVLAAARFKMTGQNKVWLSGNILLRGLMEGDEALVKQARDSIMSEICVGRAEGIKADWSFHQHGPQQQFGNYGLAYISSMGFYYRLFRDTPFSFGPGQEQILRSFINEGYKWTVWNRNMDVSALGRQLFHNAQLHKAYAIAFTAADFGIDGFPENSNLLVGHRHFDDSDYTVHRAPAWMASVKMSSSRVIGTEVVNEDNHLGYYLGDGATYYYVRGDEYRDVFPFLDWRKIPGVTAYEDDAPIPNIRQNKSRNRSGLVGGLGRGNRGMSVMGFDRDSLKARKAWLMTDEFVLCLGGAISSDSLRNVTTAIDTRMKRGPLTILEDGSWREVDGMEHREGEECRIYHDSVGYIVMAGDPLHFEASHRTGSWSTFMKMYQPATVEGDVVSLHLTHGIAPEEGKYLYFVLPASTPAEVATFDAAGKVRICRNDAQAQIIELKGENPEIWAAVYEAAPIDIDGMAFSPSAPGIYCIRKGPDGFIIEDSNHFKI